MEPNVDPAYKGKRLLYYDASERKDLKYLEKFLGVWSFKHAAPKRMLSVVENSCCM